MIRNLKGIIFDFDGLICDSETPEVEAWQRILPKYGLNFSLENYLSTVGAVFSDINAGQLPGIDVSNPDIKSLIIAEFNDLFRSLVNQQPLQPGLEKLIQESISLGLKLGIASSSPRKWVISHLKRLKIWDNFKCVLTREDVKKTKPDPELFEISIRCLGLSQEEIIVFEDSPNGINSAKKANLFTIAIPNEITRLLDLTKADLILDSFEDFHLQDYLKP